MDSVGARLLHARLQLGTSLEDIRAKTCIATRVLNAIENDDLSQIDGPFFYRSFVRQFANAVQVRYEDLADLIQGAIAAMPQPLMPGEGRAALPKIPPLRVKGPGSGRWLSSIASLVAMFIACSAFNGIWQNAAPPAHPAFHVELSAVEATWLSIVADGKKTFSGVLGPSETKVLDGYNVARVRTGNAGAINMIFNGKPVGTLGPRGQVRIAIFRRNGYEIVEPPVPLALALFKVGAE